MKKYLIFLVILATLIQNSSCSSDDKIIVQPIPEKLVVTPGLTAIEFALGEAKELTFEVTGSGAYDLVLEVIVPEGWNYRTTSFVRDGELKYKGVLNVTAPKAESKGDIKIKVTNSKNLSETGSIAVEANRDPLAVSIEITDELLVLDNEENRLIPFTVRRNNPVELRAEVVAESDWIVEIESFLTEDVEDESKDYTGTLSITSPDKDSESEIVVNIINGNDNVVATAVVTVQCIKKYDLTLDAQKNIGFALGETSTSTFTVKGKDAKGLTASVKGSAEWGITLTSFELEEGVGYTGIITIVAPDVASEGTIDIEVTDGKDVNLTATISVFSAEFSVTFTPDPLSVSTHKVSVVKYIVERVGDQTLTSALIFPYGWRIARENEISVEGDVPHSFVRDEESGNYEGKFYLFSSNITENNTLYLKIKSTTTGKEVEFPLEIISGEGTPKQIAKKASNCIVVSQSGDVVFDAKKGDGTSVSGTTVKWIWADKAGLIDETTLKYEAGNIKFSTAPTFTPGNVLIALFDSSDKIVWSWHIWIVSGLNTGASPGTFMNMNLGALSSTKQTNGTDNGFFYQWGRKEPFVGPKDRLGKAEGGSEAFIANTQSYVIASGYNWSCDLIKMPTHEVAAQHPTTMAMISKDMPSADKGAWSDTADPCPFGWRVPTHMELREHWDLYNTQVRHPGVNYNGVSPTRFPDEWWAGVGSRMADTGGGNWMGGLRNNGSGYYWSSISTGWFSKVDPDESLGDSGYKEAEALSCGGYNSWVSTILWNKQHGNSVRCIKE